MHMGTLRHQKQSASKPAGRKNTAKKPKTPGKIGRFARRLGLVAGIATGIIAPSLSSAQDHIKKQVNTPADSPAQITMASAGERAPANTYVVPTTDGKDTTANLAMNARAKPDGEKKMEPGPDPSLKWCDGIAIEDGKLIFRGVSAHEKHGDASVDISKLLEVVGLTDATTANIKWQQLRIINGEKKAYFVVETERMSVLMSSNPDFEKGDDTWGRALYAPDGTKIFSNSDAICVTDDGSVVATTPTTLLIIQTGMKGKKFAHTYKEMFGEDVDNLKNPRFNRSTTNDTVELRDETMITPQGKKVVITIPIYRWDGISASIDEMFSKN